MRMPVATRRDVMAALAALVCATWQLGSSAQGAAGTPPSTHVTIPFLANATKPADLEFEGGDCELDAGGKRMACTFQQVFLTTTPLAPDTCLITTNRYARTFDRESPTRWVSREGPDTTCGLLDVATLEDGGGGRWTLEMRKVATRTDASASCAALQAERETLSWQNIRRSLPCRFVQPGGLSR